LNFFSKLCSS